MKQKRELFRFAIQRPGHVRRGAEAASCEVLDLTEKGVHVCTGLAVNAGEELQLDFTLTETCPIHCTVLVTHVTPPHFGARITAIAPDHAKSLSAFIEQLAELNLQGF